MRVAVYTRASTDEAHQPYSLDAQTTRLHAYISSQPDWQLVFDRLARSVRGLAQILEDLDTAGVAFRSAT